MSTTTARAFRLAAKLDALLSDNADEQARCITLMADPGVAIEKRAEAEVLADRAFDRGETLVARRLVVDRYLTAAPLAA